MQKALKPQIIKGKLYSDTRGSIKFINDFSFQDIKRFYEITHQSSEPRAFHGHLKEAKYAYVVQGKIILCLVKVTDIKNPSKKEKVIKFSLSSDEPQIVYIPPGFANGFKTLEPNTKVIFFSTASLEESKNDDYRYPYNYWGMSIWNK